MPINDFIQFHFGWLNAWIPSFALVLIQLLYMILYREGGKRAVDTSWYTSKDKRSSTTLSVCVSGTIAFGVALCPSPHRYTAIHGGVRLVCLCTCRILWQPFMLMPLRLKEKLSYEAFTACRAIRCTSSMSGSIGGLHCLGIVVVAACHNSFDPRHAWRYLG